MSWRRLEETAIGLTWWYPDSSPLQDDAMSGGIQIGNVTNKDGDFDLGQLNELQMKWETAYMPTSMPCLVLQTHYFWARMIPQCLVKIMLKWPLVGPLEIGTWSHDVTWSIWESGSTHQKVVN